MRHSVRLWAWLGATVVSLAVSSTPTGAAGPHGPRGEGPPARVLVREAGQPFCPRAALVYGAVVIPGGRCYALALLRDTRGTFLVFMEPGTKIPPGQLVRLSTPAGPKLRGRIFFAVPLQTPVVLIPLNTITLVATRIEDFGTRLAIVLVGTPSPSLTVIFSVHP